MSRALRVIASIAIGAAAVWSVYRLCYLRYACNLTEARAQARLTRLLAVSDQATARIVARQSIEEMTPCVECAPANVTPYMIRAAALRMLGRPAEAAMDYRRALHVDRRAELYFNLGLTELDAGREEQAADALTTAVFIFYPYIDDIPQPMQERVRLAVTPVLTMIHRQQATPDVMAQLRARMTRDPL